MYYFAKTPFKLGQSVPVDEKSYPKSHFLSKTAVSNALKEIARRMKKEFVAEMAKRCMRNGGAASEDGVHLKVNGKHFC